MNYVHSIPFQCDKGEVAHLPQITQACTQSNKGFQQSCSELFSIWRNSGSIVDATWSPKHFWIKNQAGFLKELILCDDPQFLLQNFTEGKPEFLIGGENCQSSCVGNKSMQELQNGYAGLVAVGSKHNLFKGDVHLKLLDYKPICQSPR